MVKIDTNIIVLGGKLFEAQPPAPRTVSQNGLLRSDPFFDDEMYGERFLGYNRPQQNLLEAGYTACPFNANDD